MKKIILAFAVIMMCMFSAVYAEGDVAIKLIVDSKVVPTETVSINDRTLVPLRSLMESTGAEVKWYGDTSEIDVIRNESAIRLKIDSNIMKTSDGEMEMDVSPILYNDETTYVPLRAICEAFSFTVEWDEDTKTILIHSPGGLYYVDLYEGATVAEYVESIGVSPEEFSQLTGLNYGEIKDDLYIKADNAVSFGKWLEYSGLSYEEGKELLGLGDNVDENTPWGEALGEISLKTYIEIFAGVGAYGYAAEDILDSFREYYGLGEEYTVDTKFKFVRVIIDQCTLDNQIAQAEEEKQKAADEAALAELCETKVGFTITLADGSVMKGELYPLVAPKTVANFINLCNSNFYEGLIFHRVIDDFMIQGGGYDATMIKKVSQPIVGEFYANGISNALKHERGVISMARTNDPNSASSEFFIMDEAAPHLDGSYAAFGRITEGFDVLDKIATCETQVSGYYSDVPVEPIVIKSIVIEE